MTVVCALWTLLLSREAVGHDALVERKGARKRDRVAGAGSAAAAAAFRSELPLPVDPLFTDQREIRLSLPKVINEYFITLIK